MTQSIIRPWDGSHNYAPGELCMHKGKIWRAWRHGIHNPLFEPGGFQPGFYWEEFK